MFCHTIGDGKSLTPLDVEISSDNNRNITKITPAVNNITKNRMTRLLNIALRLARIGGFNENLNVRQIDGKYNENSNILKLLDFTQRKSNKIEGINELIALLNEARVPKKLIINEIILQKMSDSTNSETSTSLSPRFSDEEYVRRQEIDNQIRSFFDNLQNNASTSISNTPTPAPPPSPDGVITVQDLPLPSTPPPNLKRKSTFEAPTPKRVQWEIPFSESDDSD